MSILPCNQIETRRTAIVAQPLKAYVPGGEETVLVMPVWDSPRLHPKFGLSSGLQDFDHVSTHQNALGIQGCQNIHPPHGVFGGAITGLAVAQKATERGREFWYNMNGHVRK